MYYSLIAGGFSRKYCIVAPPTAAVSPFIPPPFSTP